MIELETTAAERDWAKTQYVNHQWNMIPARLLRDHDRLAAENARLTTELAEARMSLSQMQDTAAELTADLVDTEVALTQARADARSTRGET